MKRTAETKGLESLQFETEIKLLDEGNGLLTGYAAVFGNLDRVGDVIEPNAFKNLSEFERDGWASYNHWGTKFPIGMIKAARQDERGLYVEILFHDTPEAQDARKVCRERLAAGKRVGMSIWYRVISDEMRSDRRHLKELAVYECGPVTLPANPMAQAIGVKSDSAIEEPTTPKRQPVKGAYLRDVERRLERRQ